MNTSLDRLARNVSEDIELELQRIGILCRIFERAKDETSIEKKLAKKQYKNSSEDKKMQDIIGVRVVVYFKDDLPLVHKALKSKFDFIDETVDEANTTVFEPNRINLIFRLKKDYASEVHDVVVIKHKYIDTTYEVQLRTILSEGWHEIEHDLRYKCSEDWDCHKDLSRILNGIYASLETNDWSILSLFDKLSYEHYKNGNLSAMLRNKFRIRLSPDPLNSKLEKLLVNNNSGLIKKLFRVDRMEFLNRIFDDGVKFPLTLSNLVFVLNGYYFKEKKIFDITPSFLINKREIFDSQIYIEQS